MPCLEKGQRSAAGFTSRPLSFPCPGGWAVGLCLPGNMWMDGPSQRCAFASSGVCSITAGVGTSGQGLWGGKGCSGHTLNTVCWLGPELLFDSHNPSGHLAFPRPLGAWGEQVPAAPTGSGAQRSKGRERAGISHRIVSSLKHLLQCGGCWSVCPLRLMSLLCKQSQKRKQLLCAFIQLNCWGIVPTKVKTALSLLLRWRETNSRLSCFSYKNFLPPQEKGSFSVWFI